jgi:hypothetical protein
MQIVRTEQATGGPSRTERSEIVSVFAESDEVEPDMAVDLSGSMSWEISPPDGSAPSRWAVVKEALRQFVGAAGSLDSQAAQEQAGGSDEMGGVYTACFSDRLIRIGAGDDGGDLNLTNFDRKTAKLSPGGGTRVMEAIDYLDGHYLDEFSRDEDSGAPIPVSGRPLRARVVWTDGELTDAAQFGSYLLADHSSRWPGEQWFIAIVGHGDAHDATLAQYQKIAAQHPNVHVYSFDQVSNPAEIAEDMAIAVLGKKTA